jgi:hypothetical protein
MIRGLAQTEMSGQSLAEDPFPKYNSLSVLRSFIFVHFRLKKEEVVRKEIHPYEFMSTFIALSECTNLKSFPTHCCGDSIL